MSYGLDKLKLIGVQKIHEVTHLTKHHVKSILDETFEGINRVQFVGFISILEREYNVDLSELKTKGMVYFQEINDENPNSKHNVFVTPKKKKNLIPVYITLVVLIFIAVAAYSILSSSTSIKIQDKELKKLDNKIINSAEKIIEEVVTDVNISSEVNSSTE